MLHKQDWVFIILSVFNIFVSIYDRAILLLWRAGIYKTHKLIGNKRYRLVGRNEKKLAKFFILGNGGSIDEFGREFGGAERFILVREARADTENPRDGKTRDGKTRDGKTRDGNPHRDRTRRDKIDFFLVVVDPEEKNIRIRKITDSVDENNEVCFKISLSVSLAKIVMKSRSV